MKEYIERAAVHELVKRLSKYQMFSYDRTKSLVGINPDDVDFGVDKIQAADVVEVVRCRECVHNHPEFVGNETQWCELCRITINSGDFCSYGKRKIETVLPKSDAKDESLEADHEVS